MEITFTDNEGSTESINQLRKKIQEEIQKGNKILG